MSGNKSQDVKWWSLILIVAITVAACQLVPPVGLSKAAWHSALIFVATIISIVVKVLPIDAVGIIGITIFTLVRAVGDKTASDATITALSELSGLYDRPWLY